MTKISELPAGSTAAGTETVPAVQGGATKKVTVTQILAPHADDSTDVHGIVDTAALETATGAQTKVDTHSADTTAVHGIADTSVLVTTSALATALAEAANTVNAPGSTETLDCAAYDVHNLTGLDADLTLTLSNPATVQSVLILLSGDGTNPRIVTFPGGFTLPVAAASSKLAVTALTINGGTNWSYYVGKDADTPDWVLPIITKTASYTLVRADAGRAVHMNVGSANNLTVPANSSVAFAVGTVIEVGQYGAGQTTLVQDTGVTIRSSGGKLKLTGQYSKASLHKIGTNEWWLAGDIAT